MRHGEEFSLMLSRPHKELFRELHGGSSLAELGLCPGSSLVAFPSTSRGLVRHGHLVSALEATDGDAMDDQALDALSYQDLLDLEERMGSAAVKSAAVAVDQCGQLMTVAQYHASIDGDLADLSPRCAICLDGFSSEQTIRVLHRCQHVFHADCVDAWIAQSPTCPTCKTRLL